MTTKGNIKMAQFDKNNKNDNTTWLDHLTDETVLDRILDDMDRLMEKVETNLDNREKMENPNEIN